YLLPFGAISCQRTAPGLRDAIVPSRTSSFNTLERFNESLRFQLMEGRIQSAFLEIQDAFRSLFDLLCDAVSVALFAHQSFENQGRQRAFKVHNTSDSYA